MVNERGIAKSGHGLAGWLTRIAPARARGTVCVALVSDARIRALNRIYRGKDYATDVLSFPEGREGRVSRVRRSARGAAPPTPPSLAAPPYLGDIVIALGVMHRQARRAGHSPKIELRVLALHGLLHLLGYDHDTDAGRMRRIERRLRRKGGLPESLIERAAP